MFLLVSRPKIFSSFSLAARILPYRRTFLPPLLFPSYRNIVFHLPSIPFSKKIHCLHKNEQKFLFKNGDLDLKRGDDSSLLTSFYRLLKPDWFLILSVTTIAMGAAVINVYTPSIIADIVNIISVHMSTIGPIDILQRLQKPASKLLCLFSLQGFLTFAYISLVTILGERIAGRLKMSLYSSLMSQDISFFDATRVSKLTSTLTTDISDFKHSFKQCISQGIKSVTQVIGSIIQLIAISPSLSSYLALSLPILYGCGNLYAIYLRKLSANAKDADSAASALATERLTNIKTVRAFASEEVEVDNYYLAIERASNAAETLGFHIGIFQGVTNFSIGCLVLIVLYVGGGMIINNDMSGGDLMNYLISIQNTQKSLALVGMLSSQAIKGVGSLERIEQYIKLTPLYPPNCGIIPKDIQGNISLKNVSFSYPTRKEVLVLKDINLSIPSGNTVALCGLSGSGKSTIATLLERFYEPESGSIFLDDQDIKDLDPR
jgi:ATP-binding cassette subfamily B (MDR/TAP) protein 8